MENHVTLRLSTAASKDGHPWCHRSEFSSELPTVACVATVLDGAGDVVGSGLYDPNDPVVLWRRFSRVEGVDFDAAYLSSAIDEAFRRRSDEHCQRLISGDADYLPGLEVEIFEGILTISSSHPVVDTMMDEIVQILREACEPKEIVFFKDGSARTLSGQNLKARWIEIDDLAYRLDLLNAEKPRFFLDQREQHALVGSLCEGRCVLDGFAHSGAFGLQAARNGAEHVVAVDHSEACIKSIGATAQKNDCFIEGIQADVAAF